ncbi:fimbrial protein [Serratia fonticola]|uniref:fimbrial protein n=1 Tax=Serratia fonticola TaxID=47917 RepID=UPI003AAF6C22
MKINSRLALLAILVLNSGLALADNVTVNVTGRVTAIPCTLDLANSDLNVNLGDNLEASDLANVGATSTPVPFKLVVNSCPTTTVNAIATFGGSEDTGAPGRYVSSGTARNIAVEVRDTSATSALKGPGTSMTQTINLSDRTATFDLQASIYSKGAATGGTIASTMQVSFTYQ